LWRWRWQALSLAAAERITCACGDDAAYPPSGTLQSRQGKKLLREGAKKSPPYRGKAAEAHGFWAFAACFFTTQGLLAENRLLLRPCWCFLRPFSVPGNTKKARTSG